MWNRLVCVCPWIKGSGDTETFILMADGVANSLGVRSNTVDCGNRVANPPAHKSTKTTCTRVCKHADMTHTDTHLHHCIHNTLWWKSIFYLRITEMSNGCIRSSEYTKIHAYYILTYCMLCIREWLNAGKLRLCFHRLQAVSVWCDSKDPAGFEDGGLPLLGQPLKPHAQ